MQRRLFTLIAVVMFALGLAACGSSSKSSDSGSPAASSGGGAGAAPITIKDFKFTVTPVKAGATVTVANNDTTAHSVVSDTSGQFGTDKDIDAGSTGTITAPATAGSYPFHCGIHNFMKATLVVQ